MKITSRNFIVIFLQFLNAVFVMLLSLYTCAPKAHADEFVGRLGKENLTLTCEGPVVDTPCLLKFGNAVLMEPRFTSPGISYRYSYRLKRGLEKVIKDKQHPSHPNASDIRLLRSLDLDKCYPAVDSASVSGDALQLCIPTEAPSVILYQRGFCDRCDFGPIVLRKQATQ